MGWFGLGQYRSLGERGILFCLFLLSFSFSLSPFPLPTPSQQSSDFHYRLTKPSQLRRPPHRTEKGAERRPELGKNVPRDCPRPPPRDRRQVFLLRAPGLHFPFTFQGTAVPRQLAGGLTFLPWPCCSICPQIGSQPPSRRNRCQFIKWEHVAQKTPRPLGRSVSPPGPPWARAQDTDGLWVRLL